MAPRARSRADELLVARGLLPSRSKAQAYILGGRVWSGDRRIEKAGQLLAVDAPLDVKMGPRFVSRGGEKLEGALQTLGVDPARAVCVDVGASTGGFTDCLLQHGATKVYAVDVGHGQLDPKLRRDPRVVTMERTNARDLVREAFSEPIALVVVDASFIGLEKLLPALARLLRSGGRLLALVKPQFEAGRREAQRGRGVIRDPAVRESAIARVRSAIASSGFELVAECDSCLPGPKGNLERFVLARRTG